MLNLTPHAVTIIGGDGETVATFPPSGHVARITCQPQTLIETVSGVQVFTPQDLARGEISGVPDLDSGDAVIVSMVVGPALARRHAGPVYGPDMGPESAVRDTDGRIIGVRRLVRYSADG